jgi:hypothetical protein
MLAWPVAAQVKLGDLTTQMSGNIAPGYSADYGNMTGSDHNWALGGTASLSGSYYDPNFLSFNVGLYLNQSRANSDFQSISDASGINANVNLFGGSHFPGSLNYSKAFNSEGNYAVPGLANYVTHGNSDTFGINWSENIPNAPSFAAAFQLGGSKYSVYGTNDEGNNTFRSLNLHSSYNLVGFNMGGYYSTGVAHSLIPQVVSGQADTETQSDNSGFGFNVGHQLPLRGSFSAGFNRSTWNSEYLGANSGGTIDLLNALASVHPTAKLSFSASASYSDNLAGQLMQAVVGAGGAGSGGNTNDGSNSLDLLAVASYTPAPNLLTSASGEHRSQFLDGESYGLDSVGGNVSYSHRLLDGNLSASVDATENFTEETGASTLGFSNIENYSAVILGWHVNGSFGYSQNVQTLLVTYTNSFYNYSGNARRTYGKLNVSMGASAGRTALTEQAGTANSSQSYSASLGYGSWLSTNGSYSKSSGEALATGTGLVPIPVPPPILPAGEISLYGGSGYSIGLSSTPVRSLVLAAAFARSNTSTSSGGATSANLTDQYNTFIQYQFRKTYFNSGFARLGQGFSGSGMPAQVVSSFYIGVSRWFNFF